jgi:beta-phosphoglucomutase-like phosphatase (HAD superfamily)
VSESALHRQPVRAFIFDMDGTMIDSMPFHARSWTVFAQRHGLSIELDDLMRRTTGRNGAECMRELFGPDLPEDEAWRRIALKEAIYRELFAAEFRAVPGFTGFAARAAQAGLRVGVGTAGDRDNIAFAFARLDWAPLPHAVVGGDEGLAGKPQPDIFLAVANRLGVAPAHCVVFEDAPLGIEAARRAGMRAVAVCTGHRADELAGPHVLAAVADFTDPDLAAWAASLHKTHDEETSDAP